MPKKGSKQQFCVRGHDTFICGRDKSNSCKDCRKEDRKNGHTPHPRKPVQFCPQGHDTFVVGRWESGRCKACIQYKPKPKIIKPKPQFCPNGHDINIYGRNKHGSCNECHREYLKIYCEDNKEKLIAMNKELYQKNIIRRKEIQRLWREKNKEARRLKRMQPEEQRRKKIHSLKKKFNLAIEDYEKMLEEQNHRCAICKRSKNELPNHKSNSNLCVDHNHSTGKIRGLLCSSCNLGLGNLMESKELLKNAIDYLNKYE